jgi:hypothetical protein
MHVQIYRMESGNYELNTYFSYEKGGMMAKGGEPYDSMTKYQLEKEYKKLNEKRDTLKKKYGSYETDEIVENEKEIDKIITLLYGEDFSGKGQKFKYADGGQVKYGTTEKADEDGYFYIIDVETKRKLKSSEIPSNLGYGKVENKFISTRKVYGNKENRLQDAIYIAMRMNMDNSDKKSMAKGGETYYGSEIEEIGKAITEEYGITKNDGEEYGGISRLEIERILKKEKNRLLKYKGRLVRDFQNNIPFFEEIIRELKKDGWNIIDQRKGKYADGGMMAKDGETTIVDSFGSMSFRNQYDEYEMVVVSKELEKDGGSFHKDRFFVSAKDIDEAKKIAIELWQKEFGDSDLSIVKVMSNELYKLKYMNMYADGGKVKFADKVKSIKSSLLKRKKVSPKVQKDYGKTYSPKEAEESAKRIVGAMKKNKNIK